MFAPTNSPDCYFLTFNLNRFSNGCIGQSRTPVAKIRLQRNHKPQPFNILRFSKKPRRADCTDDSHGTPSTADSVNIISLIRVGNDDDSRFELSGKIPKG